MGDATAVSAIVVYIPHEIEMKNSQSRCFDVNARTDQQVDEGIESEGMKRQTTCCCELERMPRQCQHAPFIRRDARRPKLCEV